MRSFSLDDGGKRWRSRHHRKRRAGRRKTGLGRMDYSGIQTPVRIPLPPHLLDPTNFDRTMIAVYMLDGSFHYAHNIPTFTCGELQGLLLPTPTTLWQSCDRSRWEYEYENYLSDLRGRRLPKMADILSSELAYFNIEEWISRMDNFGVTVLAMVENCRENVPDAVEEGGGLG